jgi:hypothetical protein
LLNFNDIQFVLEFNVFGFMTLWGFDIEHLNVNVIVKSIERLQFQPSFEIYWFFDKTQWLGVLNKTLER